MTAEILIEENALISQINDFRHDLTKYQMINNKIIVNDQEGVKSALSLASCVKTSISELDALRKRLNEPARKSIAIVNDAAKQISDILEEIQSSIKIKL